MNDTQKNTQIETQFYTQYGIRLTPNGILKHIKHSEWLKYQQTY